MESRSCIESLNALRPTRPDMPFELTEEAKEGLAMLLDMAAQSIRRTVTSKPPIKLEGQGG